MPNFILFLRKNTEPPTGPAPSPAELQAISERYFRWNEKLVEAGRRVGGNKLHDPGRQLRKADGKVLVTDGPYSELKEMVAGYWMIKADSFEQALEITRDCPHLDYGTIEIREIHELPGVHLEQPAQETVARS